MVLHGHPRGRQNSPGGDFFARSLQPVRGENITGVGRSVVALTTMDVFAGRWSWPTRKQTGILHHRAGDLTFSLDMGHVPSAGRHCTGIHAVAKVRRGGRGCRPAVFERSDPAMADGGRLRGADRRDPIRGEGCGKGGADLRAPSSGM